MKRILIVEDDRAIAELERDYLEANDYEVEICEDGESGLKRALQEDFALILLDVMLPKEDGFQVCRNLRASKNVPIILVSAKREDMDKIRGLGLGANDYIVKPFNPSELIARVKSQTPTTKTCFRCMLPLIPVSLIVKVREQFLLF